MSNIPKTMQLFAFTMDFVLLSLKIHSSIASIDPNFDSCDKGSLLGSVTLQGIPQTIKISILGCRIQGTQEIDFNVCRNEDEEEYPQKDFFLKMNILFNINVDSL